ncbi:MAG TPA: alpha-2-macroglobulin family protein, partial [Azospirillaceae bacterium]|nr:alpha-2-macroglobulin family protein [Azospirillaceae bacterium]
TVTVAGVPTQPPAPESRGVTVERRILNPQGKPVDLAKVRQNDLLVVIVSGRAEQPETGTQAMVVDLLPAGLEIENVRLADSAQLGNLSWLGELSQAAFVAARDDRFEAAVELTAEKPEFRLVYLARAVNVGSFVLPAPRVAGLDQPALSARGPVGTLTVLPRP